MTYPKLPGPPTKQQPDTGEREPCKAWVQDVSGWVALYTPDKRHRLAECWRVGDMWWWALEGDNRWDYGLATMRAAQLAAEDAIMAECAARMAVIMGGNDNA